MCCLGVVTGRPGDLARIRFLAELHRAPRAFPTGASPSRLRPLRLDRHAVQCGLSPSVRNRHLPARPGQEGGDAPPASLVFGQNRIDLVWFA